MLERNRGAEDRRYVWFAWQEHPYERTIKNTPLLDWPTPTQSRTQPHTNALILMSDFGLILISNCIKFLDIIHDINVKICKHMFDLNVKHRTIWMWLTLILTSILPDEMASGSDSESLYLVERMGRSNIGPIFGHVVIYYFYVYVKGLAAE